MHRKKRHGIRVSLIIITATSLVLTLSTLGYYLLQYRESELLNEKIVEIAFGDDSDTESDNDGHQTPNGSIDHAALFAINSDYAGWLVVEGTEISLPIVYHAQEQYYLRRDFDKNRSVAGTLFLDYQNNKDFSDTNTMIFGHSMKNGSMFAPLQSFLNKDFFDANRFIYVSTPGGDYRYEIFAVYQTTPAAVPYVPGMLAAKEFDQLLSAIKAIALYDRYSDLDETDKILTLATCGYNYKNARIIIHAKLVQEQ